MIQPNVCVWALVILASISLTQSREAIMRIEYKPKFHRPGMLIEERGPDGKVRMILIRDERPEDQGWIKKTRLGYVPLSEEQEAKLPKYNPTAQRDGSEFVPPNAFYTGDKWPNCPTMREIRNQRACGCCWAAAGASVLSDRLCIATNGAIQHPISFEQAATCSSVQYNKTATQGEISGADPVIVFRQAALFGMNSGGEADSGFGCIPFSFGWEKTQKASCVTKCTENSWPLSFDEDKRRNMINSYWVYGGNVSTQTARDATVLAIQQEVFENGPVSTSITVTAEWKAWSFTTGPYVPSGKDPNEQTHPRDHAVHIVGWNVTADGIRYWIFENSWGESWAANGFGWVVMGQNALRIEESFRAPIIKGRDTICDTSTFCTKPIDSAINLNAIKGDLSAPSFLFQGDCTLEVKQDMDGSLSPVGTAEPLDSRFMGAPSGPVTGHFYQSGTPYLFNTSAQVFSLSIVEGSHKIEVGGGWQRSNPGGITTFTYDKVTKSQKQTWYQADKKTELWTDDLKWVDIGTLITGTGMTTVNALLDLNGTGMNVFGTDAGGNPMIGVMSYQTASTKYSWIQPPKPASQMLKCSK